MRTVLAVGVIALAAPAFAQQTVTVYMAPMWFSTTLPQPGASQVAPIINVGDTIRWECLQGTHTSTSVAAVPPDVAWDSGYLSPGQTFEHQFNQEGTFWYYCIPHGQDNGDGTASGHSGYVVVVPAPGALGVLAGGALLVRRRRG